MKKNRNNRDMPIGKLMRVKDFLPPPHELVIPEDTVKITISLKKTSVEFFKREAKKHHAKYQKMIRELLDHYASNYEAA
jgi:predicted DNA binding CopG/RHH family protein